MMLIILWPSEWTPIMLLQGAEVVSSDESNEMRSWATWVGISSVAIVELCWIILALLWGCPAGASPAPTPEVKNQVMAPTIRNLDGQDPQVDVQVVQASDRSSMDSAKVEAALEVILTRLSAVEDNLITIKQCQHRSTTSPSQEVTAKVSTQLKPCHQCALRSQTTQQRLEVATQTEDVGQVPAALEVEIIKETDKQEDTKMSEATVLPVLIKREGGEGSEAGIRGELRELTTLVSKLGDAMLGTADMWRQATQALTQKTMQQWTPVGQGGSRKHVAFVKEVETKEDKPKQQLPSSPIPLSNRWADLCDTSEDEEKETTPLIAPAILTSRSPPAKGTKVKKVKSAADEEIETLKEHIEIMKGEQRKIEKARASLTPEEQKMTRGELEAHWAAQRREQRYGPPSTASLTEDEKNMSRSQLRRKLAQEAHESFMRRLRDQGVRVYPCETCGRDTFDGDARHFCARSNWSGPLQRRGGIPQREQLVVTGSGAGVTVRRQFAIDKDKLEKTLEALHKVKDRLGRKEETVTIMEDGDLELTDGEGDASMGLEPQESALVAAFLRNNGNFP